MEEKLDKLYLECISELEKIGIKILNNDDIGNININGFDLKLNQITDEAVSITGKIENFDFERR